MKNSAKPGTRKARREVRVLPVVIIVGAALLALKAGGLVFAANAAQTPPAQAPAAAAAPVQTPAAEAAPAPTPSVAASAPGGALFNAPSAQAAPNQDASEMVDAGITAAQVDVLTSLAERRTALEERQRQLDLQANMMAATEKRVDSKIAELKSLQAKIETLLDQRDAQETAQLDSLVRVYSAMKPKDAARIFDNLDSSLRVSVAGRMKPDIMAGILSNLQPGVAQKLTLELATRYKAPGLAVAASTPTDPAPASPAPGPARTAPVAPSTATPPAAVPPASGG